MLTLSVKGDGCLLSQPVKLYASLVGFSGTLASLKCHREDELQRNGPWSIFLLYLHLQSVVSAVSVTLAGRGQC